MMVYSQAIEIQYYSFCSLLLWYETQKELCPEFQALIINFNLRF